MPFKEIISVYHDGIPDPSEVLVVVTTCGRYRFSVCSLQDGGKGKEFYIPRRYWPAAVKRAALDLCADRQRRGAAHDLVDVIARLAHSPEKQLNVGQKGIDVLVEHKWTIRPRKISLRGTITGFEIS